MLLIIGSGLYMVSQKSDHGRIPWTAGWVITSLVVTVMLAAIGATIEANDDKRLRAAIANASGELPQADLRNLQLAARPTHIVFFGTSQVVALLFLMSNRPGLAVAITACKITTAGSARRLHKARIDPTIHIGSPLAPDAVGLTARARENSTPSSA